MPLDTIERQILATGAAGIQHHADIVLQRMEQRLSCEHLISHLFTRGFAEHDAICVREVPYPDYGVGEPDISRPETLDILAISSCPRREVLVEAKQVHDWSIAAWRDRTANGGSIAGDIAKLRRVPPLPSRSRLVVVYLTSLLANETTADWLWWLEQSPTMQGVQWERIDDGDGPLFSLGAGWFDMLIHKIDDEAADGI